MKHNFLLKAVFTLIMCGSITLASAVDIYVSNGSGDDTKDGLSSSNAVKTISRAFTISSVGDVIHVMDMININQEPTKAGARADINIAGTSLFSPTGVVYNTWNVGGNLGIIPLTRSITIVGDDKASCGFDGNNTSCLIRQDLSALGANNGGPGVPDITVITYKNLTFKNGKSNDSSGGGGVYLRGGFPIVFTSAYFENCDFLTNTGNQGTTLKTGGGLFMKHGQLSLKKCRFAENMASKGAGMYLEGGNTTIDSCLFENHDLSAVASSNAAAILTTMGAAGTIINLDVKNTVFKNNKSASYGGAFVSTETNPTVATTGSSNIKFTNCAFVDNVCGTSLGGAAYVSNINVGTTQDVSFVNTTFYNNQTGANTAGAIAVNSLLVNSKFNLINCTVSGNKVTGVTGAGGAGVRFLKGSSAGTRTIKNSILENNVAVDANMTAMSDYADLGMEINVDPGTFVETPSYTAGTNLIIEKSIIGFCQNADFATQFPMNNVNYVFDLNGSIANSYVAKLGVFNEEMNYFPLMTGSPAIAYGNSTFLSSLTPAVTTDQIGRNRPAVNCSAGAYEFATISGLNYTVNNSITVYKNANNQITVKNNAETTNVGTITVCNMVGQIITSAPLNGSVTTINKQLTSGIYLVLVNINGNVSTKKVMLN
ncbi:MAG: T9SS type A sorting domain-containing protein [Paludibacter sp.]|nr:T9SS type A sorting domain-containing protein [Paludibacter sp.]